MTEPHGPLQGVKVVACSTAQAGTVPYMPVSYTHLTLPTTERV